MNRASWMGALVCAVVGCSGAERGDEAAGASDRWARDARVPANAQPEEDAGPALAAAPVVINEVVADSPGGDAVELLNLSDAPVDLTGYFVTDDPSAAPQRAVLPAGTVIGPRAFLTLPVGAATLGFGLGSDEAFALSAPDGRLVDLADWPEGAAPEGRAWGRSPDGVGGFATLSQATLGEPNAAPAAERPAATPLVINEVVAAGMPDVVELYNGTFEDIDLTGYAVSDDPEGEPLLVMLEESLVVPARGFALLVVSDETLGFKLGSAEGFSLSDPTGALVDSTFWTEGQSPADGAWAREPDGTGPFRTFETSSLGSPNTP
jgi:hypothetical protein